MLKLMETKKLLDALPRSSSVVITAPDKLTKELFTHKGAGTFITYGERIHRHTSLGQVDVARLKDLLESSFGRPCDSAYFDTLPRRLDGLYLSESYTACAIVTNAGDEASVVVANVIAGQGNYGYNASTGEYGDLVEMGVLDPTKVTRTALQNAASVSGLLLTTEALVAEQSDDDDDAHVH